MRNLLRCAALGAALASALTASATSITPGGATVTATNAITITNNGIVASITGPLTADTFTGNYLEYVIRDGSNPYGANDLTFVISVSNNLGSANGIEHVSNGDGFGMVPSVNVGYLAGGYGTDVPLTVSETIDGTVEFDFTGLDAIRGGTGSEFLVIQTAATNYTPGNIGVIDSSTDTVSGFVPAAATPEPNSLLLLGSGLIGTAGVLSRRNRVRTKLG